MCSKKVHPAAAREDGLRPGGKGEGHLLGGRDRPREGVPRARTGGVIRIEVHDRKSEGEGGGPVPRSGGDDVDPRVSGGADGEENRNLTILQKQNKMTSQHEEREGGETDLDPGWLGTWLYHY